MTNDDTHAGVEPEESAPESARDSELHQLVKRAFVEQEKVSSIDVLHGVQQRLRERSGGKFYRDGWSTLRHPPFATYFITSLMMLAVIAVIYAVITPLAGEPIPVDPEPKPVQVLHPQ